jgi:hypothetical protein
MRSSHIEMAAENRHPVGDPGPGGEHELFRIRIRARTSRRDLHSLDADSGQGRTGSTSSPIGASTGSLIWAALRWVLGHSRRVVYSGCMTERAERLARPAAWQSIGRKSQIAANAQPPPRCALTARSGNGVLSASLHHILSLLPGFRFKTRTHFAASRPEYRSHAASGAVSDEVKA